MKILLVTGQFAEKIVRETISRLNTEHDIDIVVLPVQVISLLSTEQIAKYLKEMNIKRSKYDLIIIPGLCPGSTNVIEKEIGIPCFKGTIHAYDLSILFRINDFYKLLSRDKPADSIIEKHVLENNTKTLIEHEERIKDSSIKIGKLYIPINPPPFRILSELTNTHVLDNSVLLKKTIDLLSKGADIVVLGFEPLNPHPDKVYENIKLIKKEFDITVAVDTLIPSEIKKSIDAGVDIVLSIDYCNVDHVLDVLKESIPVIIPYDSCKNYLPETSERIKFIEKIIEKIKYRLENYILDPILDPPITGNLLNSIINYRELKNKYSNKPLLMGISNVVELIDADSIGINMLLTIFALEAKASLLLVVESSSKTINSTRELAIASDMTTLAYLRNSPPKDLGLDLLIVKDKRRVDYKLDTLNAEEIYLDKYEYRGEELIKPNEYFRIRVDHENGFIETLYVSKEKKLLIKSRNIRDLVNYILSNNLLSNISHAVYLGIEIGKAGEALVINKNYIQDQPLFREKIFLKKSLQRRFSK